MCFPKSSKTMVPPAITYPEEFDCLICLELMVPPIRQCRNAHALCNKCCSKVALCPFCRDAYPKHRYRKMEHKYESYLITCPYESTGCLVEDNIASVIEHVQFCIFKPMVCPLFIKESCKWNGNYKEITEHFQGEHPGQIHFQNQEVLELPYFAKNQGTTKYISFFFVYEEMFRLYVERCQAKKYIRFCVTYTGVKFTNRFSYRIGIKDKGTNVMDLKLKGICKYVKQENHYYSRPKSIEIRFKTAVQYCDSQGSLKFCIQIRDFFRSLNDCASEI